MQNKNQSLIMIIDEKTFEKVYNQYYKALVGFAYSFVNDQKASEDIVQDIFHIIWDKKQEYNDHISLKVYLYRSTRNRCINYIKHQNIIADYSKEQINVMNTEEDLIKRIMTEEVYRTLYKFINKLSNKRKEVILLSLKGFSNIEIAEKLSISIYTVKAHKKKVYSILRDKMKDHVFLLFILLGM
jgi:RNA polymerase sigma-70 factor (ECF subfamily)